MPWRGHSPEPKPLRHSSAEPGPTVVQQNLFGERSNRHTWFFYSANARALVTLWNLQQRPKRFDLGCDVRRDHLLHRWRHWYDASRELDWNVHDRYGVYCADSGHRL